ncbi:MAG: hypothetical protein ACLQVJ_22215 [Syntrophobacteraceae bacterium]
MKTNGYEDEKESDNVELIFLPPIKAAIDITGAVPADVRIR